MALPRRPLGNTGLSVSILGFGSSPLGNVFGAINEAEGIESVHEAVRQGINFFDVSPFYGLTLAEQVLGKALKDIPRENFVLSTKVGRYGGDLFDFSAERATRSVDESLQRLNVEYIDIIQCHDVEFEDLNVIIKETLPALQKLKADGKVRFIGVTGLPLKIFRTLLDRAPSGSIDVILSYCHNSLNDTTLLDMLPYLQSKGVGVISASPLSMALLTEQGPPGFHPASEDIKRVCRAAAAHCKEGGKSLSKLALQYATHNSDQISTTLVGMCSPAQVKENVQSVIEAAQGHIDKQAIAELEQLMKPIKGRGWPSGKDENN